MRKEVWVPVKNFPKYEVNREGAKFTAPLLFVQNIKSTPF